MNKERGHVVGKRHGVGHLPYDVERGRIGQPLNRVEAVSHMPEHKAHRPRCVYEQKNDVLSENGGEELLATLVVGVIGGMRALLGSSKVNNRDEIEREYDAERNDVAYRNVHQIDREVHQAMRGTFVFVDGVIARFTHVVSMRDHRLELIRKVDDIGEEGAEQNERNKLSLVLGEPLLELGLAYLHVEKNGHDQLQIRRHMVDIPPPEKEKLARRI